MFLCWTVENLSEEDKCAKPDSQLMISGVLYLTVASSTTHDASPLQIIHKASRAITWRPLPTSGEYSQQWNAHSYISLWLECLDRVYLWQAVLGKQPKVFFSDRYMRHMQAEHVTIDKLVWRKVTKLSILTNLSWRNLWEMTQLIDLLLQSAACVRA